MSRLFVTTATMAITRMLARPTATTARSGLWVESLSALARGSMASTALGIMVAAIMDAAATTDVGATMDAAVTTDAPVMLAVRQSAFLTMVPFMAHRWPADPLAAASMAVVDSAVEDSMAAVVEDSTAAAEATVVDTGNSAAS
jgi:hypothetical protein